MAATTGRWRGAVLPLALLLFMEAAMRVHPVESDALAAPSAVLLAGWDAVRDGSLLLASRQTLGSTLGGLALGGGIGLLLGIWLGLSRLAAQGAALTIELLRPIPSVALIPVAMLIFGFGYRLEMFVVGFSCLFPMLLLTQAAVRAVEPRLLEVGQVLGLSPWQRVAKIVLPAALPRIFVAFRLCLGIALVVAVTTEIASNPQGLGYAMIQAQQSLAPARMLALLVWVGLLGWGLSAALLQVQRHGFARWGGGA